MVAADTVRPQAAKLRLSELDEDEGGNLDFLLPSRVVTEPDVNVIDKTIEDRFDDNGNKLMAIETRGWAKFGDAVQEDVGSRLTMISNEEILLERPPAPGTKTDEVSSSGDTLAHAPKRATSTAPPPETPRLPPPAHPPSLRGGGAEMRRGRDDENSVRVTNLSEDMREPDLLELFKTFGEVNRVYVAVDQKTGVSRGFGFVNFVHRDNAERAINKLNGYDNLILRVGHSQA